MLQPRGQLLLSCAIPEVLDLRLDPNWGGQGWRCHGRTPRGSEQMIAAPIAPYRAAKRQR
ncbi:MAG: hypothetical protein VKI42_02445 [Synechococcaceae cyanobacterium]|nr:hypothetical protein [Synechococcaceae cyanobacterium]